MKLSRCPRFSIAAHMVLVVLMLSLAGRSEASCFPVTPESVPQSRLIADCAKINADAVDPQHPSPIHHSNKGQEEMCHLGCPALLTTAEVKNYYPWLLPPIYSPELAPLLVSMTNSPQTPPPRFG